MSTVPISKVVQADSFESTRSLRRPEQRIVAINRKRRSIALRVAGRAIREIRAWMWKRRLSSFGSHSAIAAPSWIAGGCSISIGDHVRFQRHARLEAINSAPDIIRIIIGDGTVIHPYVHIGAIENVSIGCGALLAAHVYITDHDHDWANPDEPVINNRRARAAAVDIGDYVWLGERVMVLKGVRIGARSVIGAGSIVTRDIPSFSIAVGAPARVVKCFEHDSRIWKGSNA